jgi:bacterioferritin-associated ferredoxin
MILCLCQGVRAGTVEAVIERGASSLEEIEAACAAGADCGGCHASLLELLETGLARTALDAPCAASSAGLLLTR